MSDYFNQVMEGLNKLESRLNEKVKAVDGKLDEAITEIGQKMTGYKSGVGLAGMSAIDNHNTPIVDQVKAGIEQHGDMLKAGAQVTLEVKGTFLGTDSGSSISTGQVGQARDFVLGAQHALTRRANKGTSSIIYSRYSSTYTGNAAIIAEGATKPQVQPAFKRVTITPATVAGWTSISNQALSDSTALYNAVEIVLRRSVNIVLDQYVMNGCKLAGYEWEGLVALAKAETSKYASLVDAVSESASNLQVDGFQPTAVIVSPADYLSMIVAQDKQGRYLGGEYLDLPDTLSRPNVRGLPVFQSPSCPAGKAMVFDGNALELNEVDTMSVMVGNINDDLIRNLSTIRGEGRWGCSLFVDGAIRLVSTTVAK